MEKEPIEEAPARVDQQPSIYGELQRSHDYGERNKDGEYKFSIQELEARGTYWMNRLNDPTISPRGAQDIHTILDRIVLEMTGRYRDWYAEVAPGGVPDTIEELL